MKKIYVLLFTVAFAVTAFAQGNQGFSGRTKKLNSSLISIDGLQFGNPFNQDEPYRPYGIDSSNGKGKLDHISPIFDYNKITRTSYIFGWKEGDKLGYWFGTNQYQYDSTQSYPFDKWNQTYINDDDITIVGAVALFNIVKFISNDSNSYVGIILRSMSPDATEYIDNNGKMMYTYGPGNAITNMYDGVKYMKEFKKDSISSFNPFYFQTPIEIAAGAGFTLQADFTYARKAGDSICLVSTQPQSGNMSHLASVNVMYYDTIKEGDYVYVKAIDDNKSPDNNFDCNLALFPIVDTSNFTSIEASAFYQGMKFSINPNVVREVANVEYVIENKGNVSMDIIDPTGRVVKSVNEGNKAEGKYSITIDVNGFKAGNYLFSLNCDGQRLIKRMIIE